VGLLTIGVSTHLILYSGPLYQRLSPWLRPFEKKMPHREATLDTTAAVPDSDIILVGLGNFGSGIALRLLQRIRRLVGVDFDPEVLEAWRKQGLPVFYGDVGDPEILEHLPLRRTRLVVSTVRDRDLNLSLQKNLKAHSYPGKVVLTARHEEEAQDFLAAGARLFSALWLSLSYPFAMKSFSERANYLILLARLGGFEPPTDGLEVRCSVP
jgi:hypothetical protein